MQPVGWYVAKVVPANYGLQLLYQQVGLQDAAQGSACSNCSWHMSCCSSTFTLALYNAAGA